MLRMNFERFAVSQNGVEWTPLPGVNAASVMLNAQGFETTDGVQYRVPVPTSFTLTLRGIHNKHPLLTVLGIPWPKGSRRAKRRAHRKALKKRGRS